MRVIRVCLGCVNRGKGRKKFQIPVTSIALSFLCKLATKLYKNRQTSRDIDERLQIPSLVQKSRYNGGHYPGQPGPEGQGNVYLFSS